jgi:hypothetical protein
MKKFFPGPLNDNARNMMRKLGYGEHTGHGGQMSYTRRVTNQPFPRYHAYVEDYNGGIQINLHVDQKEASYHGSSVHSGEYDGRLVDEEMERIQNTISKPTFPSVVKDDDLHKQKNSFWANLFG